MKQVNGEIIWKGRKHHAWFPLSFTSYQLTKDRLYQQKGFFSTHYDETLLYKIIDICLERTLLQKIFGTGTITLTTRSDSQEKIVLANIKSPLETKTIFSKTIEEERERRGVVGKEFYGSGAMHGHGPDMDIDFDPDDDFDDVHPMH